MSGCVLIGQLGRAWAARRCSEGKPIFVPLALFELLLRRNPHVACNLLTWLKAVFWVVGSQVLGAILADQ